MIPEGIINDNTIQITPTKTFKIDFDKGKEVGMTDGIEAVKQAIYLILNTERYQYLIFSFNYGVEFDSLAGKEREYVEAELKRRIEEALLQDDRIESIENLKISDGIENESIAVKFNVITNSGVLEIEKAVSM